MSIPGLVFAFPSDRWSSAQLTPRPRGLRQRTTRIGIWCVQSVTLARSGVEIIISSTDPQEPTRQLYSSLLLASRYLDCLARLPRPYIPSNSAHLTVLRTRFVLALRPPSLALQTFETYLAPCPALVLVFATAPANTPLPSSRPPWAGSHTAILILSFNFLRRRHGSARVGHFIDSD